MPKTKRHEPIAPETLAIAVSSAVAAGAKRERERIITALLQYAEQQTGKVQTALRTFAASVIGQ